MWTIAVKLKDGHREVLGRNELTLYDCLAKLDDFTSENGQALVVKVQITQN